MNFSQSIENTSYFGHPYTNRKEKSFNFFFFLIFHSILVYLMANKIHVGKKYSRNKKKEISIEMNKQNSFFPILYIKKHKLRKQSKEFLSFFFTTPNKSIFNKILCVEFFHFLVLNTDFADLNPFSVH